MHTHFLTYRRKLALSLLIQHSAGLSFDYTTAGYILQFSSAVRRRLVAFVTAIAKCFTLAAALREIYVAYCESLY